MITLPLNTLLNYIIAYNSYLVDSTGVSWLTTKTSASNGNCVFYFIVLHLLTW